MHRRLLAELERAGRLDRALEALPTDEELAARGRAGGGLTSPEFAVLLAYVKIALEDEINASDPARRPVDRQTCWRTTSRPRCASATPTRMAGHRLRREIVTTALVNEVVNRGGITFVLPGGRGDRRRRGRRDPGVRGRPRRLRAARRCGRPIEALDNRVADRGADRGLPARCGG